MHGVCIFPAPRIQKQVDIELYSTCTICVFVCVRVYVCVRVSMCVLAVYNKALTQRISNREFKLWTFLQGTESRVVATFLAETCVMSG